MYMLSLLKGKGRRSYSLTYSVLKRNALILLPTPLGTDSTLFSGLTLGQACG